MRAENLHNSNLLRSLTMTIVGGSLVLSIFLAICFNLLSDVPIFQSEINGAIISTAYQADSIPYNKLTDCHFEFDPQIISNLCKSPLLKVKSSHPTLRLKSHFRLLSFKTPNSSSPQIITAHSSLFLQKTLLQI